MASATLKLIRKLKIEIMEELKKDNQQAFAIHNVMCCAFADWLNLHTHFYKPLQAKLWYDKSKYYGDKGFTTEEVFKLFLEQHYT